MAILGAAAGGAFPQLTITQSQTWVPPQDGTVCIHVVGAGGAGSGGLHQKGGGAGAYAKIPSLAVTTDGSFTLVVGVGASGTNNNTDATAGGNSTIAGTNLTGTKTCGGGGGASGSSGGAAASGGSVSGSGEGWAGYTGGAGTSGGGAVGIYATGASGNIRRTDAASGGLAMSGFGIICGGSQVSPSNSMYCHQSQNLYPPVAGDLCGGGGFDTGSANLYTSIFAGNGGIGGGGGGGKNRSLASNGNGGNGGDGIILIQYLPW